MSEIQNIVVIGGEKGNPAQFNTRIEPLKLDRAMGMAIMSIYHGEIFNIHDGNNKIHYIIEDDGSFSISPYQNGETDDAAILTGASKTFTIPTGRYPSVYSLLKTVADAVQDISNSRSRVTRVVKRSSQLQINLNRDGNITMQAVGIWIKVLDTDDCPWGMLGVCTDIIPGADIEIINNTFAGNVEPAFLYVSVVDNSYINGRLSRNLGVIPLSNGPGWFFHEFNHPNYVPIAIKEFSNIALELRGMDGKYVRFDPKFKTVLCLSVRPINTS